MDFLIENWKWLTAIGFGIIELVLVLVFKKRPQFVLPGFLEHCLDWIYTAEKRFKSGSDKMSYVLENAKSYLGESFNENAVRSIVEYVLTLPEKKKGEINEK